MAVKSKTLWVVLIVAGCCAAALAGLPFLMGYLYEASMRGTWQWHLTEGNVHLRRHEYDAAIEDYTSLIEAPDFAGGYDLRGQAYAGKGEHDAAITDYTKAIELDPALAEAYTNRADVYRAKGEYDAAIKDCTRAIELRPEHTGPYYIRAVAYYFKGDYDKAWADVKECQRLGGEVAPKFLAELRKASGREE